MGRVNVLAKVDSPSGYNDGRPICVLPTMYRLWSSVLCTKLLQFWSTRMPAAVMGGLPNRAARDVTYSLQQAVESAEASGEPLSGFVLDIIKCFNALPRQPMLKLLTHLGCPMVYARSWIFSLSRMLRSSSFGGDVSQGHPSTTGAIEGDAMSVAACISFCWLLSTALSDFGVDPALFVDNWAWSSPRHEFHGHALLQLLELCRALKLSIDWNKSFAWSRDKLGLHWWRTVGQHFLPPGISLRVLPEAKDLGAAMRYRGGKILGCIKLRLAEGVRRLMALKHQPRPLQNKAKLIQTSVWPAVFFGTEAHCLGLKHIATLRTAATRALVGTHSHTNPYLALSVLAPGLQDPELFYLTSTLRYLQRALRAMPAVGQAVLQTAVQASGSPYRVTGPGSALRALLHRNGWTLHPQGTLSAPGNVRLSLFTSSSKDLSEALRMAWSHKVQAAICSRNGLARAPLPDPFTTVRLLCEYGPADQKTLALHITGAFQTAASKALWSPGTSPACPWCGKDETKHHRFLQCPAFHNIRMQHPEAIEALTSVSPHWIYAPFADLPEEVGILSLVFASRAPPSVPVQEAALLQAEALPRLHFFTDGSCANPSIPYARHAAWSVVLDCAVSAPDRALAHQYWQQTGQVPPSFQVRSCGLVPGRQTIARAEMWAALQAVRLAFHAGAPPTRIATDSSYVVKVLSRLQVGLPLSHVDFPSNSDIISQCGFQGLRLLRSSPINTSRT